MSGVPLTTMVSNAPAGRRLNLALLFLAIVIVAADKTVFAFAGPYIMEELQLSATQFGMVGGAFFFLYSLSGVGVGLLSNRLAARWVLLLLALVWTLCQAGIALSAGLAALVIFRILLGAGAGPSTAMVQFSASKWFAPHQRVLPASAINAGLMVGILIAALCLPPIIAHWGWRSAYLLLGLLSAIWALVWLWQGREGQAPDSPVATQDAPDVDDSWLPYRRLLLNRTFIGMTGLCFSGFMAAGLGLSWNPTYMQKALGYSASRMGVIVMLIMLCVIPAMLLVSRLSQRWLKQGVPYHVAMVFLPVLCCLMGGAVYVAMFAHALPVIVKTVLLGLGFVLLNVPQSYGIIVCGAISTERQRASVIAIHVALTTFAGVVAPVLAGWMVSQAGDNLRLGYERTLAIVGILNLIVALICAGWVRPEQTRLALHGAAKPL